MGQVLVRNVSDDAIDSFKFRAKVKGTSLEQEIRELIESHAPFTPEERVAVSRYFRSKTKPSPASRADMAWTGLRTSR
jgi:plasmid stability protein